MTWTCQLSAEDAGDWTTAPTWISGDADAEWAVYVVALATQDVFREERTKSWENVSARRVDVPCGWDGIGALLLPPPASDRGGFGQRGPG